MKSWSDFSLEEPDLSIIGNKLIFQSRIGRAFLATIRKDGSPRLHPVSLVIHMNRLYMFIPTTSPKCSDLLCDGRFAMQSFPVPDDKETQEFYLSGHAECIYDSNVRERIIDNTKIYTEENEVLFELLVNRVMYTKLINAGEPGEHPVHIKWQESVI